MPDLIYKDEDAKFRAVAREIEERSRAGQPVLVGTTDIDKSEKLGEMLRRGGIPHEVLNAKQHEREALIVAQAGKPGAVTVATNMAGRGTDIVLGGSPDLDGVSPREWEENHKRVLDAGGLHIIGTERHEARRIDNQLRGRAGRQGDPGSTQFYVALDDDVIRRFGGDRIRSVMDWAGMEEDEPISSGVVSKAVENSQVKVEAYHFDMRKHLVEYDDVVNTHRDVIYGEREKILSGADLKANVRDMLARRIGDMVEGCIGDRRPDDWDIDGLTMEMATVMPPPPEWANVYELADGMNAAAVENDADRTRPQAARRLRARVRARQHAKGRARPDARLGRRQLDSASDGDGEPAARHRAVRLRPARPAGNVQERGDGAVSDAPKPHTGRRRAADIPERDEAAGDGGERARGGGAAVRNVRHAAPLRNGVRRRPVGGRRRRRRQPPPPPNRAQSRSQPALPLRKRQEIQALLRGLGARGGKARQPKPSANRERQTPFPLMGLQG